MTGPDTTDGSVRIGAAPSSASSSVAGTSLGEMVKEVTSDLSKLMSQELQLAKLELSQEAKKAGTTAGAFAGAGVAGYFLVLFASLTLMFALRSLFDSYVWAALVVTLLWAIAAAVLYSRARATAKTIHPKPETTVQTLKEDAQWAKTRKS